MRSPNWKVTETFRRALVAITVLFISSVGSARPWSEHTSHLSMLSKQIETHENDIRALIGHKKHAQDPKRVADIIREIDEHQKAIIKASKDYNEEREHVRFEHPEKNDQLDRTYVRHEVKSLEELEGDLTLDARLDRVKSRALSMFPLPPKEEKAPVINPVFVRKPASEQLHDEAPDKVHLVK